jgi:hypothetical protein
MGCVLRVEGREAEGECCLMRRRSAHTKAGLAFGDEWRPVARGREELGHSDTRMVEKHYGHLAPSFIAEAIRAGAPRFGFSSNPKLATL